MQGTEMIAAGVALGLAAATCQSLSYLFSRLYVTRQPRGVLRLLVYSHVLMGAVSAALVPLLWPAEMPPLSEFALPLAGIAAFYLAGQGAMFFVLRHSDASRASPLLGLKILVLAMIGLVFLDRPLGVLQWSAVALGVLAAAVLSTSGGRLPWRAMGGILAACMLYSLSDLSIVEAVERLRPVGRFHAAVTVMLLSYVACGLAALATLPFLGRRRAPRSDWRLVCGFSASWMAAMAALFCCFAAFGEALYGNILQSMRGVISVAIGALLARAGWVHLERRTGRAVFLRRVAAAGLMVAAIALYGLGSRGAEAPEDTEPPAEEIEPAALPAFPDAPERRLARPLRRISPGRRGGCLR